MGPLGNGGMTAWWSQFHFLRPEWLFAVPAVIAVGWWLQRRLRSDRQFEDQIAPHLVRHLTVSPDSKRFLTPGALIVPLWLVCVVALAGPTFRQQPAPFADDEAAVMLVVRVSDSMMNEDLAPSRLERARVKLASLLEERGNAGNGLIAYNGTAHLVMPVTNDAGVIDHMLEALDPKIMPREGDALAEALDMAEEQLRSTGRDGSILLVTDATQSLPPANETGLSTAVQILAIVREPAELQESGIPELAEQLQSPVHILASDDRDVQAIVSGSKRVLVSAKAGDRSSWRDDGYYLVPFLVLGGLMWARPGWALHP